jgi:hypothetical protein
VAHINSCGHSHRIQCEWLDLYDNLTEIHPTIYLILVCRRGDGELNGSYGRFISELEMRRDEPTTNLNVISRCRFAEGFTEQEFVVE